jgi:hypothetical protein
VTAAGVSRALAILLDCSSVALRGSFPGKGPLVGSPLSRRTRGPVDLLVGQGPCPATLRPRASVYRHAELPSLELGGDGALWRPGLALGLPAQRDLPPRNGGALIISQRPAVADHLLGEAGRRDLPLLAALATGSRRPQLWRELALAAAAAPNVRVVLLALQQRVALDDLARCARELGNTPILLHLSDAAQQLRAVGASSAIIEADSEDVAPALGLPCFATLAQLCEGARHLLGGVAPHHGQVLPIVREAQEIPLLERALELARLQPAKLARELAAAGLRTEGPYVIAPGRQHLLSRALRRARPLAADALVCAGRVPRALGVGLPQLSVGPFTPGDPARPIDESGLAALGSLLAAREPATLPPLTTPPLPESPQLDEQTIKLLAQQHGIELVDERVVASATAAAKAADELEPPLSVRPLLLASAHPRLSGLAGADRQRVHRTGLASTASVRQAFRDVLFACADLYPDEPLEGVIVAEAPPPGLTLDCLLLFPDQLPLARLIVLRGETTRQGSACWVRFPLSEGERTDLARRLARQIGPPPAPECPRRGEHRQVAAPAMAELRRLLERLEALATRGATGLQWLSLSPLRVPEDGRPARLVAARGEQRWLGHSATSRPKRPS